MIKKKGVRRIPNLIEYNVKVKLNKNTDNVGPCRLYGECIYRGPMQVDEIHHFPLSRGDAIR